MVLNERMIFIKTKKIFLIISIIVVVLLVSYVGFSISLNEQIKQKEDKIAKDEAIVSQIEITQSELHDAAEALRHELINDIELANMLSAKWNEIEDKKSDTKKEITNNKKELENLKKQQEIIRLEAVKKAEAATKPPTTTQSNAPTNAQWFELTAYCYGNKTATGTTPTANRTIAVDPRIIPLGKKVYIEGYGTYIAEDTGGAVKGNIIDIYIPGYDNCIQFGRRKARAWIVE